MRTKMPMPTNNFAQHFRKIAQRFLLTAVVIDDELSLHTPSTVHSNLKTPDRTSAQPEQALSTWRNRSLNVDLITSSFCREGMVCGVISPQSGRVDDVLVKTMSRADIVILDWRLSREGKETALPFLKQLLLENIQHQLRLIAIYTGEKNTRNIIEKIETLRDQEANYQEDPRDNESHVIDFGACRIVVYVKPATSTVNPDRVVDEKDLANRLITDFASKIEGLLPSIVLTALTAVRQDVFRVLECFGHNLDPAFLAHRACLKQPQESEQHIVEQISSELHGIMEDAIASEPSPAGMKAIEYWFAEHFGDEEVAFNTETKTTHDIALKMLRRGLENMKNRPLSPRKHHLLSRGFSKGTDENCSSDQRFASVMTFRQVLAKTPRLLSMGTVVENTTSYETLLCVTPRCDSIRLTEKTSFLFVLLSNLPKQDTPQVVVPVNKNEYRCMTVSMDWRSIVFSPDCNQKCVLTQVENSEKYPSFRDANSNKYRWIGELKPEFAQSVAHFIGQRMSRIPLNKSEWLRRSERED